MTDTLLPPPAAPRPPVPRNSLMWSAGAVAAAAGLAALADLPAEAVAVAAVAAGTAGALMLRGLSRERPAAGAAEAGAALPICHRVTLARAALAAALAGGLVAPEALAGLGWAPLAAALVALALDGVDGWLARRQRNASPFGARFDMEVDAALIAVLAGLVWVGGKAGAWVLALGLMRYAFVAAAWLWPWLAAPLPASFRRKAVCVLQVAVLAALLAPPVAPPAAAVVAGAALAALAWSFAVDIRWLWRHRPAAGAGR